MFIVEDRLNDIRQVDILSAFALWLAATLCVGAAANTLSRSWIGVLISVSLIPLPAFVAASPVAMGFLTFAILVLFAVSLDFAFGRRPEKLRGRLIYTFAFLFLVDTYQAVPNQRWFDKGAVVQTVGSVLASAIAIYLWTTTVSLPFPLGYVMRCFLTAVVVLALAEGMTGVVRLTSAAAGATLPPVHNTPYLSKTVSDFWSRRWNMLYGGWLRRHFFSPLASRSPLLALVATFLASAVLHAYLFLPIDSLSALSWAVFFAAQPLLLLAERKLQVRKWRALFARAWTVSTLVVLLPLLVNPILPLFHTAL